MTVLRSLVFNLLFFGWTGLLCLLGLPLLALPRSWLVRLGRLWARGIVGFLAAAVGLRYELRGLEHRGESGAIYAFKHQSAWDTIMLPLLTPDPMIVLKKELMLIPFFGWYLWKTRQIAIDRRGGGVALKKMLRRAEAGAAAGRPIVIFPEGTRTAPGHHRPYQPGVAALYAQLRRPVIPVALNSGLFWGRRRFLKRRGRVVVAFLPPIAPGLSRGDFLAELERRIEGACQILVAEAQEACGKTCG
ncbi:MAG TPA: lysophospholipid acyltransferase family protein [Alphaproteobacteria bacterium]|nr:lysophospholipid acyltransferase family protein [Alphaproteobacteria bacterium]